KNWPLHRRLLSKFANIYVKTFTRGVVNDNTAGYVGIKREVIPNISLERIKCEGYAYQIELKYRIAKKKYKVHEVPIVFVERVYGQSKISKNIIFEAFLTVIRIGLFGVKY
ncbi:MAG: polyprenol monophosphomannose synthase, partial [Elusimicrobiota bacterium]